MYRRMAILLTLALAFGLSGCFGKAEPDSSGSANAVISAPDAAAAAHKHEAGAGPESTAAAFKETPNVPLKPVMVDIINAKGVKIGDAMLVQGKDGVLVRLTASKLPEGRHGFHFHEKAACDPPDFKSAGEHFNPNAQEHGYLNPNGYHAGDLPNVMVGSDGKMSAEVFAPLVTLERGKPNSLLKPSGTALMIHEKADDYKTNPAGDAGARIACGAIKE